MGYIVVRVISIPFAFNQDFVRINKAIMVISNCSGVVINIIMAVVGGENYFRAIIVSFGSNFSNFGKTANCRLFLFLRNANFTFRYFRMHFVVFGKCCASIFVAMRYVLLGYI